LPLSTFPPPPPSPSAAIFPTRLPPLSLDNSAIGSWAISPSPPTRGGLRAFPLSTLPPSPLPLQAPQPFPTASPPSFSGSLCHWQLGNQPKSPNQGRAESFAALNPPPFPPPSPSAATFPPAFPSFWITLPLAAGQSAQRDVQPGAVLRFGQGTSPSTSRGISSTSHAGCREQFTTPEANPLSMRTR